MQIASIKFGDCFNQNKQIKIWITYIVKDLSKSEKVLSHTLTAATRSEARKDRPLSYSTDFLLLSLLWHFRLFIDALNTLVYNPII